jgi:uncharacterized membrane protein
MPRARIAAVALSLAGGAIAIYLTMLHFQGVTPACVSTGAINCEAVLSSPYAVILGSAVPTSAAGVFWFAVSAGVWMRPFGAPHLAWSAAGLLTVVYLVFVEIVRVGAVCLWCTAVHAIVLTIALLAVTLWSMESSRA